jgi:hypothetical protein
MRSASFALLLGMLSLGLAACTVPSAPARPKITASLGASDLVTRFHYERYKYDSGGCPFFGPLGFPVQAGTVLVGAANHFEGGSGPFPCILKDDSAYRGGVRFNLAELRSYQGIVIEKATISWTIDRALVRNENGGGSGVASGPDVSNCVGALMEGTKSPFTQGEFLPGLPYRNGRGDVTSIVQSWVMNGDPNWGFVLVGLDESYSRNNAACLNTLSNFKLTIIYTRA